MMAIGMRRAFLPVGESWTSARARGPLSDAGLWPYCVAVSWAVNNELANPISSRENDGEHPVAI